MKKVINFTDVTKDAIIRRQKTLGFELVGERNHPDDKHLVFDDGLPLPRDYGAEIDNLKARVEALEKRQL